MEDPQKKTLPLLVHGQRFLSKDMGSYTERQEEKCKSIHPKSKSDWISSSEAQIQDEQQKKNKWQFETNTPLINVGGLKSQLLKGNKDYEECVSLIKQYNEEILSEKQKGKNITDGQLKYKFYSSLMTMLHSVSNTMDRNIQMHSMRSIADWAREQIYNLSGIENLKKLKAFEGDRGFMVKTLRGQSRDFSQHRKSKDNNQAIASQHQIIVKSKNVGFITKTGINYSTSNDESINTWMRLDESTRDQTMKADNNNTDIGKDTPFRSTRPSLNQTMLGSLPFLNTRYNDSDDASPQKDFGIFRNTLNQSALAIKSKMPSTEIPAKLEHYKSCARTQYSQYEPPQERLREIKNKAFGGFDESSKLRLKSSIKLQKTYSSESLGINSSLLFSPEKLAKFNSKDDGYSKILESLNVTKSFENDYDTKNFIKGIKSSLLNENDGKAESIDDYDRDSQISQGINLQPRIKCFVTEPQENQVNSSTFEAKSSYQQYIPSEDIRETRMEQKWLNQRNKDVTNKREHEEMTNLMREWSLSKGRLEKEINRKLESNLYGSQFKSCDHKPKKSKKSKHHKIKGKRVDDEEIKVMEVDLMNELPNIAKRQEQETNILSGVEKEISKKKIENIKLFHGKLMNINVNDQCIPSPDLKLQPSLSIYSREVQNVLRPFSAILEAEQSFEMHNEQIQEIKQLKYIMNKHNIAVPLKNIAEAILRPQGFSTKQELSLIPTAGSGLLSNPFFVFQSKKKKGRKRR